MKHVKSLLAVVTIIIMGLVGCSKGTTGPAGPAGPVGPAGPDSVLYSPWITLNTVYNSNDTLYEDTITAPSITNAIIDSGVILSYVQFTDQNSVVHIQPMASLGSFVFEDFSVGKIDIAVRGFDLTNYLYRYVIIPGSKKTLSTQPGQIKGYTPAELKAMPYQQALQVISGKN